MNPKRSEDKDKPSYKRHRDEKDKDNLEDEEDKNTLKKKFLESSKQNSNLG